jgi:hypothetical protein
MTTYNQGIQYLLCALGLGLLGPLELELLC